MEAKNEDSFESCAKRCGGCKFISGVLAGLLAAGAGFGLYMAGRCSGNKKICPISGHPMPDQPAAPPVKK